MFSRRDHPDGGQLLRFHEGELKTRELARIERHVRGCWECRTHLEEVGSTIGDYVRYRREILKQAMPPPPAPWANLEAEMLRLRDRETRTAPLTAFRFPLPWIFAGLAAMAASAAAIYLAGPRPRGAPEIPAPVVQSGVPARPAAPRAPAPMPSKPLAPAALPASPEDELNVIAALHGIGADLGDAVSVTRQRDRIVVNAAGVDDPARAATIRESIKGLPKIFFDAKAPDSPHPSSAVAQPVPPSSPRSPLASQFTDAAAYQKFVDRALESGDAVMARVYALRSLADRFPPAVEAQLSPEGMNRLTAIRREHATALVEGIRILDRSLSPVLPSLSLGTPLPPAPDWQSAARDLFSVAQRTDRLIAILLGAAGTDSAAPAAPADVARALTGLTTAAAAYQRQ